MPPSPSPSPTPKTSPTPAPSPYSASSLFSPTDVPAVASENDPNSVEIGVKFQSTVPGTVTAIRFYKGAKNIGSHTGNLWSAAGKLLGSVTFTNETTSGWQQATLATPVALSAATSYVVSYHTSGFYSADSNFFSTAFSNGPLTAAASSSSAGNGLYAYGQASSFPISSSAIHQLLGRLSLPAFLSSTSPCFGSGHRYQGLRRSRLLQRHGFHRPLLHLRRQ